MLVSLLGASSLIGFASAACLQIRQSSGATLPTPANDPFYFPTNYTSLNNGAVIASRSVSTTVAPILSLVSNVTVATYQVSYRTSGPSGEPLTAVATVWVPTPKQPNLLVSYQTPEDSNGINCSPSYNFLAGVNVTALGTATGGDVGTVALLLLRGYTVVVSDYETSLAAFGIGQVAGRGTLDGIRAAIAFNSSGLNASSTLVAATGYSGGSLSTSHALALQPTYAPELKIVAGATGGLPSNLTANALFLDGTIGSGFIPITLAGFYRYYAGFRAFFDAYATDFGRTALQFANSTCLNNVLAKYPYINVFNGTNFFTNGATILQNATVRAVFDAQTLGLNSSQVPKVPIIASHCIADQTVPFPQAYQTWTSWCNTGSAPIQFMGDTNPNCSHTSEYIVSLPSYFDFIAARFAGASGATNCSFTNSTRAVPAASALGANATLIYGQFIASLSSA